MIIVWWRFVCYGLLSENFAKFLEQGKWILYTASYKSVYIELNFFFLQKHIWIDLNPDF